MHADRNNDTIAAISTPSGQGGIGIVRLSGKGSFQVADRIFTSPKGGRPSGYPSHSIRFGHIRIPDKGDIVDEVLLAVMRAPGTYTSEDVVEVNCHGGPVPLRTILKLCLDQGARLAEPGEFTKRAFLNGRMDLSQAEAVLDMIRSESEAAQRLAAQQLKGVFSEKIRGLRDRIIRILSDIELAIDFTEEDVQFASSGKITRDIKNLRRSVKEVLDTSGKGMILRRGIKAVICGRPNVGKSSLMNALLRHDRVIVTPVAGTTRDVIEESMDISGVMVRLSDTAGIIGTRDRVGMEGVKRSRQKLLEADVAVFMVDASRPLSGEDRRIYGMVRGKRTVVVINKIDLPRAFDVKDAVKAFETNDVLEVSALRGRGLDKIEAAIAERSFGGDMDIAIEGPIVSNLRHKTALEKALEGIERGIEVTDKNYNGELLSSDLNEAFYRLGLITGESAGDDVLDSIFSQFCIGK